MNYGPDRRTACYISLCNPCHKVSDIIPLKTPVVFDSYSPPIYSLELVVWLVPSLIGGAVAVAFVGMLLGPIYPIAMNHSGRILPPWLLTGSIGWIAGFGQAGSAFLPFLTGLLASKEGIKSLQPL